MRPRQAGVHAFGQLGVGLPGDRAQPRRVGVGQIHELRPDQWRSRGQVQVVADQHRLADLHVRSQPAGRVGQHHGPRARRARRSHRVHHMAQVMPLVGVNAARQYQHPVIADGHRQQLARVPGRARRGEPGNFGLRQHGGRGSQRGDGRRPSGSENYRDVMLSDPGALADDLGRAACEFVGIGLGASHTGEPSECGRALRWLLCGAGRASMRYCQNARTRLGHRRRVGATACR